MLTFTKSQRLLHKRDYDFVFAKAERLSNANVILLYRPNLGEHPRLGLAIAKKVVAKACDRNRLKRLIRESFRQAALPAIDIIMLAKKGVHTVDNRVILDNLRLLWGKLGKQ